MNWIPSGCASVVIGTQEAVSLSMFFSNMVKFQAEFGFRSKGFRGIEEGADVRQNQSKQAFGQVKINSNRFLKADAYNWLDESQGFPGAFVSVSQVMLIRSIPTRRFFAWLRYCDILEH